MHFPIVALIFLALGANFAGAIRQTFLHPAYESGFPYLAYIEIQRENITLACNGAIIAHNFILTAAKCYFGDEANYTVTVGCLDRSNETCITRKVQRFVPHAHHPGSYDNGANDIGLLQLKEPLTFNENVQPVLLPVKCTFLGSLATVAGWGIPAFWWPYTVNMLRYTLVTVLDSLECQKRNATDYIEHFDATMFCSGNFLHGETPCPGDEGAPLTQDNVIYGITSYVSGSCLLDPRTAPAYTNVCLFTGWIAETIRTCLERTLTNKEVEATHNGQMHSTKEKMNENVQGTTRTAPTSEIPPTKAPAPTKSEQGGK